MKLSGSSINFFLYFLIFQETETLKKVPSISGNANSKTLLIFRDMELFSSSSKSKKIHPRKFFIFRENGTSSM